MIVECPACNTNFPVDPEKVPAGGVHARCSVCSEVFFVSVPEPETDLGPPPTSGVAEGETLEEKAFEGEAFEERAFDGVVEEEAVAAFEEAVEPVVQEAEPAFEEVGSTFEEKTFEEEAFDGVVEEEAVEAFEEAVEPVVQEAEATFGEAEPTFGEAETTFGEAEPTFGEAEPTFEEAETTFGEAETTFEEAETTFGEAETTFGEAETTFGEAESTIEETEVGFEEATDHAIGAVDEVPAEPSPVAEPLFGKRDPMEKARRLARVLVSDIILYNPDRHHSATEAGQVKEEFEEEIQKSWNEYVEQVGEGVANTTNFFNEALNEILARGENLF